MPPARAAALLRPAGRYSMNVAGTTGWTLTSLKSPPPIFASSRAWASPLGAEDGSARSTARIMRLYMRRNPPFGSTPGTPNPVGQSEAHGLVWQARLRPSRRRRRRPGLSPFAVSGLHGWCRQGDELAIFRQIFGWRAGAGRRCGKTTLLDVLGCLACIMQRRDDPRRSAARSGDFSEPGLLVHAPHRLRLWACDGWRRVAARW